MGSYISSGHIIYIYQYSPSFKIIIKNVQNILAVYTIKYEQSNTTYTFKEMSPIITIPTYGILIPAYVNQLSISIIQVKNIPQWEKSNLLTPTKNTPIPIHITYINTVVQRKLQSLRNINTLYAESDGSYSENKNSAAYCIVTQTGNHLLNGGATIRSHKYTKSEFQEELMGLCMLLESITYIENLTKKRYNIKVYIDNQEVVN